MMWVRADGIVGYLCPFNSQVPLNSTTHFVHVVPYLPFWLLWLDQKRVKISVRKLTLWAAYYHLLIIITYIDVRISPFVLWLRVNQKLSDERVVDFHLCLSI